LQRWRSGAPAAADVFNRIRMNACEKFAAFSRKPARRDSVRSFAPPRPSGSASIPVLGFASAANFGDIVRRFFTGIL